MKLKEQSSVRVVLYEGDGAAPYQAEERARAMAALLERGYAVTRTSGAGAVAPADRSALLLAGKFSGHACLLDNLPAGTKGRFHEWDGGDAGALLEAAEQLRAEADAVKHGEWKPWFPVIDYDRCTNCMQCLSFCLFGVYGVSDEQKIQVQNNDNCKTNCPACSRVCPEAAIMFPKYKSGPINGDQVSAADLQREKMKVDISALLGGDVYSMLRERSEKARSRFSKERDADKALKERQKCLVKLQEAGDIPLEVLLSLPSPEEIQRRAQEAMAKAQQALQR